MCVQVLAGLWRPKASLLSAQSLCGVTEHRVVVVRVVRLFVWGVFCFVFISLRAIPAFNLNIVQTISLGSALCPAQRWQVSQIWTESLAVTSVTSA